jgi:uncharacterized membrane protein YccC
MHVTSRHLADPASRRDKISGSLSLAIQYALVSLLSFLGAYYLVSSLQEPSNLTSAGAMWALISGVLVLQDTRDSTVSLAWLRILGSFVGAVISAVYLSFFPFSPAGMAVMVGVTVLLCIGIGIRPYARFAALTVGVVMVFSTLNPELSPALNAGLRFIEVLIGSVVAIAIVWVWSYFWKTNEHP